MLDKFVTGIYILFKWVFTLGCVILAVAFLKTLLESHIIYVSVVAVASLVLVYICKE